MNSPQVFLTTTEDGKIVLCNERGEVLDGQTEVVARNAVNEVDTVTVTIAHGGWIGEAEFDTGLDVPKAPPPASIKRKESEG